MSVHIDSILIKHWVRSHAPTVIKYAFAKPAVKIDFRMVYLKLEDSIHYTSVRDGIGLLYDEYVGTCGQVEHTPVKFKALIKNWKDELMEPIELTIDRYEKDNLVVQNGVHRLSIYYAKYGLKQMPWSHFQLTFSPEIINEITAALIRTTKRALSNGWANGNTTFGYHSFDIFNFKIVGQRSPVERITAMMRHIDFDGKTVYDFGCNTGGMLFHLPGIVSGVGFELDETCIDAANLIKNKTLLFDHLQFIKTDLNTINLEEVIPADICFLLSLGSWVRDWRKLYLWCFHNSSTIVLETNNKTEEHEQLELFRKLGASITIIIDESRDDITGNYGRSTFLVSEGRVY